MCRGKGGAVILPEQYRHSGALYEEVRFSHEECNDSRSRLYVKRLDTGWIYHCHNCSFDGFQRDYGVQSVKATLSRLERLHAECVSPNRNEVYLPRDFTPEIPALGLAWLYKYGMKEEEIQRFRFGYSDILDRLILPVFKDGVTVYWQGRYLGKADKDHPKYINMKGDKNALFHVRNCDAIRRRETEQDLVLVPDMQEAPRISNAVCLVEDILSAVKVGRSVNSIALLGSYIPTSILKFVEGYGIIFTWLDYDKRFQSMKFAKKFSSLIGKPVVPIITKYDPKEYKDPYNDVLKEWL